MLGSVLASTVIVGGAVLAIANHAVPIVRTSTETARPPVVSPEARSHRIPAGPAGSTPVEASPVDRALHLGQRDGVYRCTVDGRTVYADAPCVGGVAVDVRSAGTVALPRTLSTAQRPVPSAPSSATEQAERPPGLGRDECQLITRAIDDLDAQARIGGTAPRMDYLRAQRRYWEDRRYATKC